VFIDETWTKTNMTRLEGRAPRGERLVDAVPFGKWRTSTFIAGLRNDGLVAPAVFEGAINGEMFLAYVEQTLAPALRPGDLVVMDNLSSHKVAGVEAAIKAAGAAVPLFARVQPRPEPDRNGVLQAEGAAARQGAAHRRGAVEGAGQPARLLQRDRVRELPPPRRVFPVSVSPL